MVYIKNIFYSILGLKQTFLTVVTISVLEDKSHFTFKPTRLNVAAIKFKLKVNLYATDNSSSKFIVCYPDICRPLCRDANGGSNSKEVMLPRRTIEVGCFF